MKLPGIDSAGFTSGGKRRNLVNPLKMDGWLEIWDHLKIDGWLEVGLSMLFHFFCQEMLPLQGTFVHFFFLGGSNWVNNRLNRFYPGWKKVGMVRWLSLNVAM